MDEGGIKLLGNNCFLLHMKMIDMLGILRGNNLFLTLLVCVDMYLCVCVSESSFWTLIDLCSQFYAVIGWLQSLPDDQFDFPSRRGSAAKWTFSYLSSLQESEGETTNYSLSLCFFGHSLYFEQCEIIISVWIGEDIIWDSTEIWG